MTKFSLIFVLLFLQYELIDAFLQGSFLGRVEGKKFFLKMQQYSVLCNPEKQVLTTSLYTKDWKGPSPIWSSPIMVQHVCNLITSFRQTVLSNIETIHRDKLKTLFLATDLMKRDEEAAAREVFMTPDFLLLSHGTQNEVKEGPVLNYGNMRTLRQWAASWEELTTLPSSRTADDSVREDRAKFMSEVKAQGFSANYSGIRVDLQGKRFRIQDAFVWNVIVNDAYVGQAALIPTIENV